jgi:hypothetical protein
MGHLFRIDCFFRHLSILIFASVISCTTKKSIKPEIGVLNYEKHYNVLMYGAVPNDGKDDSESIQRAIDAAIISQNHSIVYIPPGVYDIQKGLVVGSKTELGEYFFVTLKLSGHTQAFSSNQQIGATSVLKGSGPGFTVAVQNARQCVIENLVFEGPTMNFHTPKQILNTLPKDWNRNGDLRINRFSPNCAIAIDPFHKEILAADQNPGFKDFYSNSGSSGSSMILIRGCSFSQYYIGIANNPGLGTSNGDNIRLEDCHVTSCHTFWASGQTQSRNNSIQNVYALYLNTFVSGVTIGRQQGTPPFIQNVNLAGFCKTVFNIQTAFSGLSVCQSYFESIWSLGVVYANTVHFEQCQVQFILPSKLHSSPPFHLYSNTNVNFTGCSIEYFDNCQTTAPFVFRSDGVNIIGGHIEGGVVLADGITNEGGDRLHSVNYWNVNLKCEDSNVNPTISGIHLSNMNNKVILGNSDVTTYDSKQYYTESPTYKVYKIEMADVWFDPKEKTITFLSSSPNLYKKGDVLLSDQWLDLKEFGIDEKLRGTLGFVSDIQDNVITTLGGSELLESSASNIYFVGFHKIAPVIKGTVVEDSDIIRTQTGGNSVEVGSRLNSNLFPQGTWIINVTPDFIRVSSKAIRSSNNNEVISSSGLLEK